VSVGMTEAPCRWTTLALTEQMTILKSTIQITRSAKAFPPSSYQPPSPPKKKDMSLGWRLIGSLLESLRVGREVIGLTKVRRCCDLH